MGEFSVYHWLIVLLIVVLLFGGRRIPGLMKGLGEGIRSLKEGLTGKGVGEPQPPTETKESAGSPKDKH